MKTKQTSLCEWYFG